MYFSGLRFLFQKKAKPSEREMRIAESEKRIKENLDWAKEWIEASKFAAGYSQKWNEAVEVGCAVRPENFPVSNQKQNTIMAKYTIKTKTTVTNEETGNIEHKLCLAVRNLDSQEVTAMQADLIGVQSNWNKAGVEPGKAGVEPGKAATE